MKSTEKFILDHKRDQFRVKIRNDSLNVQFTQNRRKIMLLEAEVTPYDAAQDQLSQMKHYLAHSGDDLEQRVYHLLSQPNFPLTTQGSDSVTLTILCNICASRSPENVALIHQHQIAHKLLNVAKSCTYDDSLKNLHTCIWGLSNYMASSKQNSQDLTRLISDGVVDFVLQMHHQITEGQQHNIAILVTISDFFSNLLYQLNAQKLYNILSQQQSTDMFMEMLKDLKLIKEAHDFQSLQTIYYLLDWYPLLFNRTTKEDINNLLDILDLKSTILVYHTLKVINVVSCDRDETNIQRMIYMTMIDDVQKHIHHENQQIRMLCYKILSNLSCSSSESILESVGRQYLFRETVLEFHHCQHPETAIEMIHLLGNLVENCVHYIGTETIQDSGLSQILQDKLHDCTTENADYVDCILRLILAHLQLRLGTYDTRLKIKCEHLMGDKNECIVQTADILLSYMN